MVNSTPPVVATFEKVSFEEYLKQCRKSPYSTGTYDMDDEAIRERWEAIKLPVRATASSAGYDFFSPQDIMLYDNDEVYVPTGIKAKISDGWFLLILPRSSYGMKYGMHLSNTAGVIDADYYGNKSNEGHIMAKFRSDSTMHIGVGDRFMQGIFLPYGITDGVESTVTRIGGIGSTGG